MRHFVTAALLLFSTAPFFQANCATSDHPSQPAVVGKFLSLFDRLRAAQENHDQVSFKLSEAEINDYLRSSLKSTPRPGLEALSVKVFAKDYLSTFTRVDFDAVEQWHPGTVPAVLRPILKGKKSIWIDIRLHADGSQVTFTVEKARYEEMALPPFFVEKMIGLMAARQPEKYDTSKPIPLPFGLSKIWTTEHEVHGSN